MARASYFTALFTMHKGELGRMMSRPGRGEGFEAGRESSLHKSQIVNSGDQLRLRVRSPMDEIRIDVVGMSSGLGNDGSCVEYAGTGLRRGCWWRY